MTEISDFALLMLTAVVLFGAVLGLHRLLQRQRLRAVPEVVRDLEGTAKAIDKSEALETTLRDEADLQPAPALYGIRFLAWILTLLLVPLAFCIFFFENLAQPYPLPEVGETTWFAYRAPARFTFVERQFERHQLLVPEGKNVSFYDRQLVSKALESRRRVQGRVVAGTLLLLVVFLAILLYHLSLLYPEGTEKNRNLILIYLIMLMVLALAKLSFFYDLFSPFLIPVPWAGMAITILINRRIVPLTMLITVIVVSLVSHFDFTLFLVLLAGGLASGTLVRRARKRSDVMLASLFLGVVMVLVLLFCSMWQSQELAQHYQSLLAAFANGAVSGLLLLITLPLFEAVFDLSTPFRLMELLDLNTPVLKELFFKAPGTYQHSMAVANIAEAVASELGADDLLVRVGAYYHDIGKMFNPQLFIENQGGQPNPHDTLGPVASAAAVRSHVILGVQLARQVRLPGAVIDFIAEHHGTSTIDYFYYKSRQLESEIKSEKVFKYPGPKPRSRETAIVMLVDSVEAASRVLDDREEISIRALVNRIFQRKLEQGELDHSGLQIGDLKKIVDTLVPIVKSSGHTRIVYPASSQSTRSNDRNQRSAASP